MMVRQNNMLMNCKSENVMSLQLAFYKYHLPTQLIVSPLLLLKLQYTVKQKHENNVTASHLCIPLGVHANV
jgi:hypothetical protein